MVARVPPTDLDVTIKFGGGLHTRASASEIDPREAAEGANFLLDPQNRNLRNRPPFDLIGTAPNGQEIRGGFSLLKSDGTIATAIQAGERVYEWDGGTGFTSIGTVNSSARLRGHWRSHMWTLSNKVLITDLELLEPVREWDGATFDTVDFTDEDGDDFGTFFAKYLSVSNERALFAHVKDGSATTPHMMVGAKRGDYTVITITDRPASSLSAEDPFFLLAPDLRPINALVEAFGSAVISTEKGQLFNLSGTSAANFAFSEFYAGSGAAGQEAVSYIGNDILYGRPGRIESLRDTDRFGESEADDITAIIADQVEDYKGWRIVFNSRLNRAYCFPDEASEVWVLNIAMRGGEISPWMRWTTTHALAFRPTFVMSMLDPSDGLEYVFMGDTDGNFYRMEGSGTSGDGGSASIATEFLTKLYSAPLDAKVAKIEGEIKYHKNTATTVTLNFEYGGVEPSDHAITITLPALSDVNYFGGSAYFGGAFYFGARFENRLIRQRFGPPGQASDLQVRVSVTGTNNFFINEILLRMKASS